VVRVRASVILVGAAIATVLPASGSIALADSSGIVPPPVCTLTVTSSIVTLPGTTNAPGGTMPGHLSLTAACRQATADLVLRAR
jgi:hypothetical protein